MNASEAKKLTDIAAAERSIGHYNSTVRRAAERGETSQQFGVLSSQEGAAFEALGYKVLRTAGGVTISWGHAK